MGGGVDGIDGDDAGGAGDTFQRAGSGERNDEMADVILYYSFGGATEKYARKLAEETGAALVKVTERKRRGMLTAFFLGCPQSVRGAASEIVVPDDFDFGAYDDIVIAGPIWAGHSAPPVNAIVDLLPEGKTVTLVTVSGAGNYEVPKTVERVQARGCTVREVKAVKAADVG